MVTPTFDVYVRPGLSLSATAKTSLLNELRELGILCLNPLPDYQIFSNSSSSLDDKIIITARRQCSSGRPDGSTSSSTELVGFLSVVILPPIPGVHPELVFHTGLAIVTPSMRRSGLIQQLFGILALHVLKTYPGHRKIWFTSLSGLPVSLVRMATWLQDTFPSPGMERPSDTHVAIAREIDTKHRDQMCISPTAIWEEDKFVYRGCNSGDAGKCFRREDLDDPQYWHQDRASSKFYRDMLRNNGEGDAILQVGWISAEKFAFLLSRYKDDKFSGEEDEMTKEANINGGGLFQTSFISTILQDCETMS